MQLHLNGVTFLNIYQEIATYTILDALATEVCDSADNAVITLKHMNVTT
jgi:hypothetical protein